MKKKTIAKLKRSKGTVTNDQFEILREQMEFYKALYTSAMHLRNSNDAVSASVFLKTLPLLRIRTSKCVKERSPLKNA